MLKAETVGQRILIIEDEESIALGVRDALQHHGHQVDVCMDGEAGLERARAGRYDLLVLDLMLPGISGFELIETLRREVLREGGVIVLHAPKRALKAEEFGPGGSAEERTYGSTAIWYLS